MRSSTARSANATPDEASGVSVLEVPGGEYSRLARLSPIVTSPRQLLVAEGEDLIEAGFPLLPTLLIGPSHWRPRQSTGFIVCARCLAARSTTRHSSGRPAGYNSAMTETRYDLWYDATSVGAPTWSSKPGSATDHERTTSSSIRNPAPGSSSIDADRGSLEGPGVGA